MNRRIVTLVAASLVVGAAGPAEAQRVVVHDERLEVTPPIAFRTGTAELLEGSLPAIEALARHLADNPSITLEIQAHSDSRGSSSWNSRLSDGRARAIYFALIGRGVPAARLTFQGYGESCPIAPNTTAAGRAANRRIVFRRTDTVHPRICQPPPPPPPPEERPVVPGQEQIVPGQEQIVPGQER